MKEGWAREALWQAPDDRRQSSAEAARFLPILKAGEVLHVGKNPTAGCGRIEVEVLADAPR